MDWGMRNRIGRMFRPHSGRTVMLAVDHGYFMGPTHHLENAGATLGPLLPHCDAIALTRGILRTSVPPTAGVPIILRVSGGVTVLHEDLSDEAITTPIKEALRLNASAVAMSVFVGAPKEHQTLTALGQLVTEGEDTGMPVMAITAVGKELDKRDQRYLSLACRVSAELGAHLVKTYYCDGFSRVVDGCPVPVVVAGGPKLDSIEAALRLAHDAVEAGAAGVDMGRNIWQSDRPVGMLKALAAIIHESATVPEALDVLQETEAARSPTTSAGTQPQANV
ncbi:MAG: 3-hydroxy-5-phosphonooxypentane-2,4-dione thiolase [Thermoplasmata archaeon]|nr:3-hydroxy-5-phosphonooxypentane-2,4-dione thiolase [Thermoplasmata archaeon]